MLYIYDSAQRAEAKDDLLKADKARVRSIGVWSGSIRSDLRTLSNHDVLLVPSDHRHSPSVERLKNIAHLAGILVEPLSTWYARTQHAMAHLQRNRTNKPSAADTVVPPVQQRAVADGPLLASA